MEDKIYSVVDADKVIVGTYGRFGGSVASITDPESFYYTDDGDK